MKENRTLTLSESNALQTSFDEKVRISAKFLEVLEEVGRLKYGHMGPAKQMVLAMNDLYESAALAHSKGRSTLMMPAGFSEAFDAVNGRLVREALEGLDLTKLTRTGRSRGGYEGVLAEGKAWIALVPDEKGGTYALPQQFARAELAAWARYQHHLQNKIPYGHFAKELERVRGDIARQTGKWTEDLVRATAIWNCSLDRKPVDLAFLRPGEERWMRENPDDDGDGDLDGKRRDAGRKKMRRAGLQKVPVEPQEDSSDEAYDAEDVKQVEARALARAAAALAARANGTAIDESDGS